MLVGPDIGLDEALQGSFRKARKESQHKFVLRVESRTKGTIGHRGSRRSYPCIVEFCLNANIFALLLVLCPKYLQLSGLQRTRLNPTNQSLKLGKISDRQWRTTDLSASAASVWRQQVSQNSQDTKRSIDVLQGRLDMIEKKKYGCYRGK